MAHEPSTGVLLRVAYDGSAFKGWASQKEVRTVETTLRGAVLAMDDQAGCLRGTSRTDAGVHAEDQVVAFDSARDIPAKGWVLGLNRHLPEDVSVRFACAVPKGFAPRFSARSKRYRYRLLVDPVRDPYWRHRAWRVDAVDFALLALEARAAVGVHDFAGLRTSADRRTNTVRTLSHVDVVREADPRIVAIVVQGDGFLHNMVRILVGTMTDVSRGRLPSGAVTRAIETSDRAVAGTTAPAHGLVLERVELEMPGETGEGWPR